MLLRTFLPLALVLTVVHLPAQAALHAEISRDTVLMGNTFRLTYVLEDAERVDFQAPAIQGFDLIAGPSVSSVINMVNGQMGRRISYTYVLKPRGEGDFLLPPAEVEVAGTLLRTEEIALTVLPNPDGIIQEDRAPEMSWPGMSEDLFPGFSFPDFPEMPDLRSFSFPGLPDSLFNFPGFEFPAPDSTGRKKKRKIYKI